MPTLTIISVIALLSYVDIRFSRCAKNKLKPARERRLQQYLDSRAKKGKPTN